MRFALRCYQASTFYIIISRKKSTRQRHWVELLKLNDPISTWYVIVNPGAVRKIENRSRRSKPQLRNDHPPVIDSNTSPRPSRRIRPPLLLCIDNMHGPPPNRTCPAREKSRSTPPSTHRQCISRHESYSGDRPRWRLWARKYVLSTWATWISGWAEYCRTVIILFVVVCWVCRFSRDRPRFTDTMDVIKFLCKDLWTVLFRKQIDNLKTNHRVCLLKRRQVDWLGGICIDG